jgi:hypothetical protein
MMLFTYRRLCLWRTADGLWTCWGKRRVIFGNVWLLIFFLAEQRRRRVGMLFF